MLAAYLLGYPAHAMDTREIRVELVRLADGGRLLRLSHPVIGLAMEKLLDVQAPVVAQKKHWMAVFAGLLAREMVEV